MIVLTDFSPLSTGEDWADTVSITDAETGEAADFTGFTLDLEARLITNGVSEVVVSGSTTSGELSWPSGEDSGIFEILFRLPFADKVGGMYRVLITATNGTDTIQIVSRIPVNNLIVSPP